MRNKLPQLCSLDKCTACTACLNSCPQAAITMKENEKGELHPAISVERCIGCEVATVYIFFLGIISPQKALANYIATIFTSLPGT